MADTVIPSTRGGQVERYAPGDRFTATVASAQTVTGGQVVEYATGDRVVKTGVQGSLKVAGVALHDAAAGEAVTVATEGVWLLTASGSVSAGNLVEVDTGGKVRALATIDVTGSLDPRAIVGRAQADATDGNPVPIKLLA